LQGSSMDNGTVLLSESSGWINVLEALASSMTGFEGSPSRVSSIPGALRML
jgi:hypothetical protein